MEINKAFDLQSKYVHLNVLKTKDISTFSDKTNTIIVYGYPYDRSEAKWLQAIDIANYFKVYGTKFLKKIDGAFSIVIIGENNLVITDAFGTYNLYFTKKDKVFHISNKIKNLINFIDSKDIDEVALNDFILLGYVLGDKTIFKKVKKFEPGSIYKLNRDLNIEKYYKIQIKSTNEAELIECFNKQIRIGASLSNKIVLPLTAGLDSRVILSGIMHLDKSLDIFTHQTNTTKDIKQAKEICSSLNLLHHVHLWKDIFSIYYLDNTLDQFECMINPYLFIPLYGSHKLAKAYGDTIWNGNGGEIYRDYYWKYGNKQLNVEHIYNNIWIINQIKVSDYHKQLLIKSLQRELTKYNVYKYDNIMNIFYLYNRYANFTGYSLMMSGKMFKIFQPFVSKELINRILSLDHNLLKEGKLLKLIIENNYHPLTMFNLNGKEFQNLQPRTLKVKVLIKKIYYKFFLSNKYARMIKTFNNDYNDLFTNPHTALQKYNKSVIGVTNMKKDYYYITNLMAVNKFLKNVN